ncbi:MAG: glycosyl hydrolase family 28-related protein, partial [Bryobacteraceae bacterium]
MSDETGNQGFNRRQIARATALGGMWPLMAAAAPGAPAQSAAHDQTATGTLLGVHQFGAQGDAKTDDTKALQSAIDAAASRGGSVLIPPGVYLTGELQLRPHVGLIGVPAWDYRGGGGSVLR